MREHGSVDDLERLDPQARLLVEAARERPAPPYSEMSPEQIRDAYRQRFPLLQPAPPNMARIADVRVAGSTFPLFMRLYYPSGTEDERLPWMLYLHGGGWVMGGLDSHDVLCRRIAAESGTVVVALDYRLAPEHPFPAALEDARLALADICARASQFGLDPQHGSVGGDSAGGNLAAVLALEHRDDGNLKAVVLIYPNLDCALEARSYDRIPRGSPLERQSMRMFQNHYLPIGIDRRDWRVSPLYAPSVSGLPPTLLITAGVDPLRDEGCAFAERLIAEDVVATHAYFPGQIHGFVNMGAKLAAADTANAMIALHLHAFG
ncbi:alpha/beta hydrolase [Shinella sp. PSBB067]|uniref:alpha/beta hydrolase n=1 Tax=Shinella sp. PSBB067 TaxID=2715959 RepID=UPI00193BFFBE|nr:alpha/beta hydrolase [Shinella sp. PSBB067]QRI63792.1 alpha/beta hydrolase [Shinella sp. PSBB067]